MSRGLPDYGKPRAKTEAFTCTETGCDADALLGAGCEATTRSGICGRAVCRGHLSRRHWCPSHERAFAAGNYRPLH